MPAMAQQTTTYTYSLKELSELIAANLKVPVEAVAVRYNLLGRGVTVRVDTQKVNEIKSGGPFVSTPSREYL